MDEYPSPLLIRVVVFGSSLRPSAACRIRCFPEKHAQGISRNSNRLAPSQAARAQVFPSRRRHTRVSTCGATARPHAATLPPSSSRASQRGPARRPLCARGRGALPARRPRRAAAPREAAGTAGSARQSDMRAHTHTFTPSPRSGAGQRGLGTSLATVYSRMGINRRRAGGSRQANASVCVCVLHASAHVWVCACARVFAPARARVGGRRPAAAATPSLRLRRRLGPRPS